MRSERAELRSERAKLRPERADFRLEEGGRTRRADETSIMQCRAPILKNKITLYS